MSTKEEQKRDKKIIYPIFSDAAQFTLDPYWQQVFDECSKGKFPRGSGIDSAGKIIYFRSKGSNSQHSKSYKLNNNPKKVFQELKQLFHEEINLKSNRDRQVIKDEFQDICKDIQQSFTDSWQKIKRKKIKDPIIRNYILDLVEQYDLNIKETAQVAQVIKLGFLFNWIDSENVIYEDQQIKDIETLHFDESDRIFTLDKPGTVMKREYKPKKFRLASLWEKNLEKPKNTYQIL